MLWIALYLMLLTDLIILHDMAVCRGKRQMEEMMERAWVIVLSTGGFLGGSGDEVYSCLDAIQFDSPRQAAKVATTFPDSAVIEARTIETTHGLERGSRIAIAELKWN